MLLYHCEKFEMQWISKYQVLFYVENYHSWWLLYGVSRLNILPAVSHLIFLQILWDGFYFFIVFKWRNWYIKKVDHRAMQQTQLQAPKLKWIEYGIYKRVVWLESRVENVFLWGQPFPRSMYAGSGWEWVKIQGGGERLNQNLINKYFVLIDHWK